MNFYGFEIDDKKLAALGDDDAKKANKAFVSLRNEIEQAKYENNKEIIDYIKRNGISAFIPKGCSEAQALAIRYSKLVSIDMILYDYDGSKTPETLCDLVEEAYHYFIDVLVCAPERLLGFSPYGAHGEYENNHGQIFYSCNMGTSTLDLQWAHCFIDDELYRVETDNENGYLTELMLEGWALSQAKARKKCYIAWDKALKGDAHEWDELTGNELYEHSLTSANFKQSDEDEEQSNQKPLLDDEVLHDLNLYLCDAVAAAIEECERVFDMEDLTCSVVKRSIDKMRRCLQDFGARYRTTVDKYSC